MEKQRARQQPPQVLSETQRPLEDEAMETPIAGAEGMVGLESIPEGSHVTVGEEEYA